jgi:hypothetical protein
VAKTRLDCASPTLQRTKWAYFLNIDAPTNQVKPRALASPFLFRLANTSAFVNADKEDDHTQQSTCYQWSGLESPLSRAATRVPRFDCPWYWVHHQARFRHVRSRTPSNTTTSKFKPQKTRTDLSAIQMPAAFRALPVLVFGGLERDIGEFILYRWPRC